ncbi:FecR domain-containing protein [Pedobacter sp. MC2016-14]|uniref:FecR family protein n=1 Tax=Pedobacter sp. MC2016-14 TaxID=2897327 RepID=UPI001E2EF23E|nr:FecR domain-containing protein [Pedobacter sp. MC2016-14]MCD0487933.1 FecR domain-containing protein [Pedobacter sp. MC2016-14]
MDKDIKGLIKKYVNNLCSDEELNEIKLILGSGLYEQEWAEVMEEETANHLSDNEALNAPVFNAEKVLKRINSSTSPVPALKMHKWYLGLAATLLVALSAGLMFYKMALPVKEKPQYVFLSTTSGQHKMVTLSDGTKVLLNNSSAIKFSTKFLKSKREVYLNGEAFFEVVHDQHRPFIVHTGRMNVHVLGTSFNVKSYHSDANASVAVVTGKVGVNGVNKSGSHFLLPGEKIKYGANGAFLKSNTAIQEILGWQKGTLQFQQEEIRDIVQELQRWYNIRLSCSDPGLLEKRVTASFDRKKLQEVMEILSNTAGFKYRIIKNEVHIEKNGGR